MSPRSVRAFAGGRKGAYMAETPGAPPGRLGWTVAEVPVTWIERQSGESRFRVLKWLPAYLRWYGYAFATTFLRRPPRTVTLKEPT